MLLRSQGRFPLSSSRLLRRIRLASRRAIISLAPRAYWAVRGWRRGDEESELELLPILCSRTRTSIDVGANFGMYTVRMLAVSKHCVAFEPIPAFARMLSRGFGRRVEVHARALSDRNGKAELRVPDLFTGYATIDAANRLATRQADPIDHVEVEVAMLDDYDLQNVGFVKIDVEGHEEAVLRGSTATLARCRPNVLVEVEDRHNPGSVARVVSWMADRGYSAFVIVDGVLEDLSRYDLTRHQAETSADRYSRNVVLLPEERRSQICEQIRLLLGSAPR